MNGRGNAYRRRSIFRKEFRHLFGHQHRESLFRPPSMHTHSDHQHDYRPKSFEKAFIIGIALNASFIVIEGIYGILANSMSLLADAAHNLTDVLGLIVAFIASILVKRSPSPRFSYGLRGTSIIAGLFNGLFLIVVVGAVSFESVQRLLKPEPTQSLTVIIVAAIGIIINGISALMFASGQKNDINIKGAFLHLVADALVSLGVVITALATLYTGWIWLDPAVSLTINTIIIWSSWGLLKQAFKMSIQAVPENINLSDVKSFIQMQSGVSSLHDLHIWSMSTTEIACTCHLIMKDGYPGDAFIHKLSDDLEHHFSINHTTIQIETINDFECKHLSDNVV